MLSQLIQQARADLTRRYAVEAVATERREAEEREAAAHRRVHQELVKLMQAKWEILPARTARPFYALRATFAGLTLGAQATILLKLFEVV